MPKYAPKSQPVDAIRTTMDVTAANNPDELPKEYPAGSWLVQEEESVFFMLDEEFCRYFNVTDRQKEKSEDASEVETPQVTLVTRKNRSKKRSK